jgi:glycosyltransferase involved in cell wall biosynthesis
MNELTNQRVKILQLGSPTGLYGAERWILALVKHLDSAKVHSVVGVIKDSPENDVPLCQEAEKLGFETCVIDAQGRFNHLAVRKLRDYLIAEQIDILHTHFYKTDLLGLLATRGTNCKLVSTPHGWSTKGDFKLWCYEQLDRLAFPFMDAVVPLSEDLYTPLAARDRFFRQLPVVGKLLNRRFEGSLKGQNGNSGNRQNVNESTSQRINQSTSIHLITNGVDISEVEECTQVAPELQAWRNNGDFVIGYIGQLISRKGLDVLLNALAELGNEMPWRFALVGEGPQREDLEQLTNQLGLQDRVSFFGYRGNRLEFLHGFDVFVLPSRLEGIPRCLMEAMAAGKLVLASDIPGCNNLIEDQKNGLLFKKDDAVDLTEKLKQVASQPDKFSDLARAGYSYVFRHYSAARMAEEYQQLYGEMLC